LQAAIVCGRWRAEFPRLTAFEGAIRRAECEYRRCRIDDRNRLAAGIGITAAIRGYPDSSDDQRATRAIREIAQDRDSLQAAIILNNRHVEIPLRTAFHSSIRRAQCEHGRSGIDDSYRLAARVGIAAAIVCHPDACDDLWTDARIGKRSEYRDSLEAAIVCCCRRAEAPGRTAFDGPIGRTEREHRRCGIDDDNGLTAVGTVAGAIRHQPIASNELRANAIRYRVDDNERYVCAAA